jgi:hypothetical protein
MLLRVAALMGQLLAQPDDARYDPALADAPKDAVQILAQGEDYFEGVDLPDAPKPADDGTLPVFARLDDSTAEFLRHPRVQPAVQFGCVVRSTPVEDSLEAALVGADDEVALLTLAVLMHVHAPSSVAEQWAVLKRLQAAHPEWTAELRPFAARFSADAIARGLARKPPADRYEHSRVIDWTIRAAGVTQRARMLPRLVELCVGDHLHASLTAGRSIADFPGKRADAALARCVEGWRYNAADRALRALDRRNPELALRVLLRMELPSEHPDHWADALATRADASAVPRLTEILPELGYAQGSVVRALEHLATAEHVPHLERVMDRVKPEYLERLRELRRQLLDASAQPQTL